MFVDVEFDCIGPSQGQVRSRLEITNPPVNQILSDRKTTKLHSFPSGLYGFPNNAEHHASVMTKTRFVYLNDIPIAFSSSV